jgi:hypothetical protein
LRLVPGRRIDQMHSDSTPLGHCTKMARLRQQAHGEGHPHPDGWNEFIMVNVWLTIGKTTRTLPLESKLVFAASAAKGHDSQLSARRTTSRTRFKYTNPPTTINDTELVYHSRHGADDPKVQR